MLNFRKHNLWRAFVHFLFNNNEKVACSHKHTHIKARVQKPYPIYDQNGQNQLKSIPYLWPMPLKNHTLWGRRYLYSPYKRVPPPPNRDICSSVFPYRNWIGPLHNPVTWYGINYAGTQVTATMKWDFQNKGMSGWTGTRSFVLEVPLCNVRPSIINSVPCDRIVQRAY